MLLASLIMAQQPKTYTGGRVSVLPVLLVIQPDKDPPATEIDAYVHHLKVAQDRFKQWLRGQDTFQLAEKPLIWHCPVSLDELKSKPDSAAGYLAGALMKSQGYTRWNCPFVYAVATEADLTGVDAASRPFNGGHNNGGGLAWLGHYSESCQATLERCLGAAFGFATVDQYGYDAKTNPSIMSQSPALNWTGFTPPAMPGILIAEDLQVAGMNKQVFPDYKFNRDIDCPGGYVMQPDAPYDPMDIP